MRVLAVLTARNEARMLPHCLDNLARQGVETIVIDHGSDDGSREIAASRLGHGVVRIVDQPWTGVFELGEQLRRKEAIVEEERADWYLHVDADEIKEPPLPFGTLLDALRDVGGRGWNAVDFDEYVFTPTAEDDEADIAAAEADPVQALRWYYHYEPTSPDRWRINAWKRLDGVRVDLVTSGGHEARFAGRRVFPRPFVMRHYPVVSARHAEAKYGERRFCPEELAQQWHGDRQAFRPETVRFPSRERLRCLAPGAALAPDPSAAWDGHPFLRADAGTAVRPHRPDPDRDARRRRVAEYTERHRAAIPAIPVVPAPGSQRPWLTVALPVHDPTPEHLTEALQSVLRQDPGAGRLEILVSDDASHVDVAEIVRSVAGDRATVVRHDEPLGLPGNWNWSVAAATGELVHLLHQDDRVEPGFYDRLVRPLRDDPQLVGGFCRTAGIDGAGARRWTMQPEQNEPGVIADLAVREAVRHRVLCPALLVRRDVYVALGGYRTDLPYCTDWDFVKRLTTWGPLWYEPLVLAEWRQHGGQATGPLAATGRDLLDRQRSIHDSLMLLPETERARVAREAGLDARRESLDVMRRQLDAGDVDALLAQARMLVRTIERDRQATQDGAGGGDPGRVGHAVVADELDAAHRRIERLEAQLRGWITTARTLEERSLSRSLPTRPKETPWHIVTS